MWNGAILPQVKPITGDREELLSDMLRSPEALANRIFPPECHFKHTPLLWVKQNQNHPSKVNRTHGLRSALIE